MSKSNKSMKAELKKIYGDGCFFNRARIAERVAAMGGIRTYKEFLTEKRFHGKKISHQLTVHHLQHRSNGGRTTVENCANVEEIAHQYIHSLPYEQELIINDMLREFKLNCVVMDGEMHPEVSATFELPPPQELDFLEIELKPIDKKTQEKRNRLKHQSRAMKKRETQRLIDEEEDYEI